MTNYKCLKVFTFGWSPEHVIKPLIEEGISRDEIIAIIATKPDTAYVKKRVEEAFQHVATFLRLAGISNFYYVEFNVEKDFLDICIDITKKLKEIYSGDYYKFYLTGGMRVLVLATLAVARLFHTSRKKVDIRLSMEDRVFFYEVPPELFIIDLSDVTEAQLALLNFLKTFGEARFEDLAIGRTEVTVRKILTKLRNRGLVNYRSVGRKQFYRLTKLGELLLELVG